MNFNKTQGEYMNLPFSALLFTDIVMRDGRVINLTNSIEPQYEKYKSEAIKVDGHIDLINKNITFKDDYTNKKGITAPLIIKLEKVVTPPYSITTPVYSKTPDYTVQLGEYFNIGENKVRLYNFANAFNKDHWDQENDQNFKFSEMRLIFLPAC
jgi:hypothetical protein